MTRFINPVSRLVKGALGVLSLSAVSLTLFVAPLSAQTADLVLHNGRIVTVDDRMPEGTAMAVIGDRVFAVGSDEEIRQYIGDDTNVIDLDGQLAIPGFIESHGHFLGVGPALADRLDVRPEEHALLVPAPPVREVVLGREVRAEITPELAPPLAQEQQVLR